MRVYPRYVPIIALSAALVACSGGTEGGTDDTNRAVGSSSGAGGSAASGGASGKGGSAGKASGGGGVSAGGAAQGGASGKAGAAAGGSSAGGSAGAPAGCSQDGDCPTAPTMPPGCAEARCEKGKCVQYAKDADKDTFRTGKCKALDGTPIILGEDCDDTNPDVSPKGWDGPSGEGHPNHCGDGLDQDCSGTDDDGKLSDGTTCTCSPGDTRDCSMDASGKPIKFPGGKPQGICAVGQQECVDSGKWGACVDAIAPEVEVCDLGGLDEDCDGLVNDADPDVMGQVVWCCDADGDGFLDLTAGVKVTACRPDPKACKGAWLEVAKAPKTSDCDDADPNTYPGATEICDGVRNDCDATKKPDEGAIAVATWYRDDDGDGHLLDKKLGAAPKKVQCSPPGLTADDCPASHPPPCTKLWVKEGQESFDDCNDGDADIYPGNWDGPATFQGGIEKPGLVMEMFDDTAHFDMPGAAGKVTKTVAALDFSWGSGTPDKDIPRDNFGVRFTGKLVVPVEDDYTFQSENDDTAAIWIDGTKQFQAPCCTPTTFMAHLTAGAHDFRAEMVDTGGAATFIVRWSSPGFETRVLAVRDDAQLGTKPDSCKDQVDHDCNGSDNDSVVTSTGVARTCSSVCAPGSVRPCGGNGSVGLCRQGTQTCSPQGQWPSDGTCDNEIVKQAEVCDGQDNDCNGQVDENLTGAPCNVGACNPDIQKCINGSFQCPQAGVYPPPGTCDNGGIGYCYRSGPYVCTGQTTTGCSAQPVAPIDTFMDHPFVEGTLVSWDWNCNDTEGTGPETQYSAGVVSPADCQNCTKQCANSTNHLYNYKALCEKQHYWCCQGDGSCCGQPLNSTACSWVPDAVGQGGTCVPAGPCQTGVVIQGCK